MQYWLMKSDVGDYTIDQLKEDRKTDWVGVRNYQARNFMRDSMKPGDLAFFYHSNAEPSGIAGVIEITSAAKPDLTQFDKKSKYYDEKATHEEPRWMLREVTFKEKFSRLIGINELRSLPACKNMMILQKGSRLSITPVSEKEWNAILDRSKVEVVERSTATKKKQIRA